MDKDITIVSNNPRLADFYDNILWVDGDYIDVLYKVRDMVHLGHTIINHPLGASIRMFYSPYRSIAIRKGDSDRSVNIIEDSVISYLTIMGEREPDYKNARDYEFMDMELLKEGLTQ